MKEEINKIIQDLGDDKPIKGILLKSQIVAAKLNNTEFKEWINNEQNGYPNNDVPDYRKLNAIVKADINQPFVGIYQNYTIPSGLSDSDTINDFMGHVLIVNSLTEIESLCKGKTNGTLTCSLPASAYTYVQNYVRGNVERVWQEFSVSSCLDIIDKFKSKLLSFFLDLDNELDDGLDFTKIEGQNQINKIMNNNYYINAAVANTGTGNVNTGNISNNNSSLSIEDNGLKGRIQELVSKLNKEAAKINNEDLTMVIDTINEECQKQSWAKKTLKLAFNAVQGIATGIAANQLTPIITEALKLIR